MTTPKMTGMTPDSLGASYAFSPALLGASPSASQLLLAKHGRSPAPHHNFNSPEALAAMGISLNGGLAMGMIPPIPGAVLPPDENKKRELGEILRYLAMRPGRISEEGIERLAKRMGLDCYNEPSIDVLSLAAKIFLLDIEAAGNKITKVTLVFSDTPGPTMDFAPRAAAILHKNLTSSPTNDDDEKNHNGKKPRLINPSLSDFADNLERLAKTDRLSCPPGLNCFSAITGIYTSLLRIFEYEKSSMGGEVVAMCKGNGRPRMHTRGKVGLSVDYWQERRLIPRGGMAEGEDGEGEEDDEGRRTWRVLIEVEEVPVEFAHMNTITPVRTSDHWVSNEVKKLSDDNLFGDSEETVTDWLEPPLKEIIDTSGDPSSRPASSRFIARLDPPVAVPFADEIQLFNNLMMSPPAGIGADTLEALLFPGVPSISEGDGRERTVYPSSSEESGVKHKYKLHTVLKPVFGRHVWEIPFSHPKELQGVFEILRQYALVESLLKSAFFSPGSSLSSLSPPLQSLSQDQQQTETQNSTSSTPPEKDLESFMADDHPILEGPLLIDITLSAEPVFGIAVLFPHAGGISSFSVDVGRDAEIRDGKFEPGGCGEVVSRKDGGGGGGGDSVAAATLERVLAVGEDLGIAVEWVRRVFV